jgi:hypothetical protein
MRKPQVRHCGRHRCGIMATRIIEMVGPEPRRRFSEDDKARIVSEAMMPGASVLEVARRHRVCTSLVYRWRRTLLRDGWRAKHCRCRGRHSFRSRWRARPWCRIRSRSDRVWWKWSARPGNASAWHLPSTRGCSRPCWRGLLDRAAGRCPGVSGGGGHGHAQGLRRAGRAGTAAAAPGSVWRCGVRLPGQAWRSGQAAVVDGQGLVLHAKRLERAGSPGRRPRTASRC